MVKLYASSSPATMLHAALASVLTVNVLHCHSTVSASEHCALSCHVYTYCWYSSQAECSRKDRLHLTYSSAQLSWSTAALRKNAFKSSAQHTCPL